MFVLYSTVPVILEMSSAVVRKSYNPTSAVMFGSIVPSPLIRNVRTKIVRLFQSFYWEVQKNLQQNGGDDD